MPDARCHEANTLACFAHPTYTEAGMEQIAIAILRVIKEYEK